MWARSRGNHGILSHHDLSNLPRRKSTTPSGPSRSNGNDLLPEWLIHQFVRVLEDSQCFRGGWALMSDCEGFCSLSWCYSSAQLNLKSIKVQHNCGQEWASRGKFMLQWSTTLIYSRFACIKTHANMKARAHLSHEWDASRTASIQVSKNDRTIHYCLASFCISRKSLE